MSNDPFVIWSRHAVNSQALDQSFVMVARQGKQAIRARDRLEQDNSTRVAILVLASYMESCINEIIWYYSWLSEPDRFDLANMSIENRWREVVRTGFANRRNLPRAHAPERLGFTDRARYDKIISAIDEHVSALAQARNALAHGQWVNVFSHSGGGIDGNRMSILNGYSLWRVTLERNLLKHLSRVVHDLVATRQAHERDFDKHIRDLNSASERIKKGSRRKWERTILARHQRRP